MAGSTAGSALPAAGTPTTAAPGQPATNQPPAAQPSAAQPSGAQPPAAQPSAAQPAQPAQPSAAAQPAAAGPVKLAMDECGLDTKYLGDEYCIKPPPPDKGFQVHIGPSNYDNPEARYLLEPGGEVTETFNSTSGNTSDVYFYWRQYRMRPGSHHLIINATGAGEIGGGGGNVGATGGVGGRRLGGSSNIAKDNPEAGVIAPENAGVGMPLSANTPLTHSLHYFNGTDKPILKEVWVNFWYRDPNLVTEPTSEVFTNLPMGIAPGDHVVKHAECRINQPGRLLTVYGHVHSHNKRFSVWRTRGAERLMVHESYYWEHPNVSEFSSTVMNPVLNSSQRVDGAFSGVVDLRAGDVVEFECDIVNDTNNVFLGMNEAANDEMCILVGDTVGTTIPGQCQVTDLTPTAAPATPPAAAQ